MFFAANTVKIVRHGVMLVGELVTMAICLDPEWNQKSGKKRCRLHRHGDYSSPCSVTQAETVTGGIDVEVG